LVEDTLAKAFILLSYVCFNLPRQVGIMLSTFHVLSSPR